MKCVDINNSLERKIRVVNQSSRKNTEHLHTRDARRKQPLNTYHVLRGRGRRSMMRVI